MMEDEISKWINTFYVKAGNASGGFPGMASMANFASSLGVPFDIRWGAQSKQR